MRWTVETRDVKRPDGTVLYTFHLFHNNQDLMRSVPYYRSDKRQGEVERDKAAAKVVDAFGAKLRHKRKVL
jgi:hypothetical protein